MSYDRDLRIGRVGYSFLGLLNLGAVVLSATQGQWVTALSGLFWTAVCFVNVAMIPSQQQTRDEARIVIAALHGYTEEKENDEHEHR